MGTEQDHPEEAGVSERNAQIVAMRDAGASWLQIHQEFGLTRQQARYAYQLGKRAKRRAGRRAKN